jgi:flagella basal body P-ring formation protein FlgA
MKRVMTNPRIIALLGTLVLLWSRAAGGQLVQGVQGTARRVAVATRTIGRGVSLSANDFEYRDSTLHTTPDTSVIAAGWVTRRVIAAGEVLRAPAVEPPTVVTANQPVSVEWIDQNIRLTLRGIATRNASIGTRVSVRMESGRRIDGTVVGTGRVRID